MKLCAFIISVFLVFLPLSSQAQGQVGYSTGQPGTDRINNLRIGTASRDRLHSYLLQEYKRQCSAGKRRTLGACQQTVPLNAGGVLRAGMGKPLSAQAVQSGGFALPGTAYVQAGFVIYLISLPQHIIIDSVTPQG